MIYWMNFTTTDTQFIIAATEEGLCFTGAEHRGVDELEQWAQRHFPNEQLQQNEQQLVVYAEQLAQYMTGERQQLTCPLHYKGTTFQRTVWQALQLIPYGRTVAYSDVAEAIGKPTAVRAVANAIGANPIMIAIPCHRVIGKNGALTGFRGGLQLKKKLLKIEQ